MNDLLERSLEVLHKIEWAEDEAAFMDSGKDIVTCPACGASRVCGAPGDHEPDCDLAQLITDLEAAL